MYNLKEIYNLIDKEAPFSISKTMLEKGYYDNSGIIIEEHSYAKKILFSLDLSVKAVSTARRLGCDTVVTHHPAIYHAIKDVREDSENQAVLLAVKYGINVISAHLNLDLATDGIDASLCAALGGAEYRIIDFIDGTLGYGREFALGGVTLNEFVRKVKVALGTRRVLVYGNRNGRLNFGASFCGGGSSEAQNVVFTGKTKADVIVTSDVPHHVIKNIVEKGKNLVVITHYSAENYGFKKFYEKMKERFIGIDCLYFEDKRFM